MSKIAAWAAIGVIAIAAMKVLGAGGSEQASVSGGRAAPEAISPAAAAALSPTSIGEACQNGVRCVQPATKAIRRDAWGERWPFTVDEAVVVCYPPLKGAGRMVVVDGSVWATNGTTATMGAGRMGLTLKLDGRPRKPMFFDVDDPVASALWAIRPKPQDWPADTPWDVRVDWGPVNDAAARLGCD